MDFSGLACFKFRFLQRPQVGGQRIVVAVHTWQEDEDTIYVRIISARKATPHEIRDYQG